MSGAVAGDRYGRTRSVERIPREMGQAHLHLSERGVHANGRPEVPWRDCTIPAAVGGDLGHEVTLPPKR
jgi:hypothetical protein